MDSKTYFSILKTICYADIFGYPLGESEVERWIIREDKPAPQTRALRARIKKANGVIQHSENFMFLKHREHLVGKRLEKENISKSKLALAKKVVSILLYIPTVQLIGVSGSVAMRNAKRDDDIDFFIVTKAETLWLTRLATTIVVELLGQRRRPSAQEVSDKICLNMFVDERFLKIPKEKQNLYSAHEVCQLKVLYDKDNTYKKFLWENRWVRKFLPNALAESREQRAESKNNNLLALSSPLYAAEWLAKHLQIWYMRRRQTSEVINDHYLAFHPKDYTNDILTALEKRLRLYGAQV